ncbi:MAG: hypothetical protein V9H26_20070, partial [Verrucomicrobiota bacterium]
MLDLHGFVIGYIMIRIASSLGFCTSGECLGSCFVKLSPFAQLLQTFWQHFYYALRGEECRDCRCGRGSGDISGSVYTQGFRSRLAFPKNQRRWENPPKVLSGSKSDDYHQWAWDYWAKLRTQRNSTIKAPLRLNLILVSVMWFQSMPAMEFYVATNGNDTADGMSWSTALRTISHAVVGHATSGDTDH